MSRSGSTCDAGSLVGLWSTGEDESRGRLSSDEPEGRKVVERYSLFQYGLIQ